MGAASDLESLKSERIGGLRPELCDCHFLHTRAAQIPFISYISLNLGAAQLQSISDAGSDGRLRANQAPSAIISPRSSPSVEDDETQIFCPAVRRSAWPVFAHTCHSPLASPGGAGGVSDR